jgi:hypothetical protein
MSISIDIAKVDEYKITELKDYCKKNSIYFKSTSRKGEIVEIIKEWFKNGKKSDVKPRGRGRPTGTTTKSKPKRSSNKGSKDSEDESESKIESKSIESKSERSDKNSEYARASAANPNENSTRSTSAREKSPERLDSKRVRSGRGRYDSSYDGKDEEDSKVLDSEFDKFVKSDEKFVKSDEFKLYKTEIKNSVKDYSFESILHLFKLLNYIMDFCANEIDFHVINSFSPKMNISPEMILERALENIKNGNMNDVYFDLCYRLGYATLSAKYIRDLLEFNRDIPKTTFKITLECDKKYTTVESKILYMSCRDELISDKRRQTYFENSLKKNLREFCECNELIPRDVSFETVYEHFDIVSSKFTKDYDFNTEICLLFSLGEFSNSESDPIIDTSFCYIRDVMECSILKFSEIESKINSFDHSKKCGIDYTVDNSSPKEMYMLVRMIRPYSEFSTGRLIPNSFKVGKISVEFNNSILFH